MADCREKGIAAQKTGCTDAIQFDPFWPPRRSPNKGEADREPILLAQGPTPGKVTGIPQYNQIPEKYKRAIEHQSVERKIPRRDDNKMDSSPFSRQDQSHPEVKPPMAKSSNKNGACEPYKGLTLEASYKDRIASSAETQLAKRKGDYDKIRHRLDPMDSLLNDLVQAPIFGGTALGAAATTDFARRQLIIQPRIKDEDFQLQYAKIDKERRGLARLQKSGSGQAPEAKILEERIKTYDRLKLGSTKTKTQQELTDETMAQLKEQRTGSFSPEEIDQLGKLKAKDSLISKERSAEIGGAKDISARVLRGTLSGIGAFWLDKRLQHQYPELARALAPTQWEIGVVSAMNTLPVPDRFPGAQGNIYEKMGAQLLWRVGPYVSTKAIEWLVDSRSPAAHVDRHEEAAQKALTEDRKEKTPSSMSKTIEAWKLLADEETRIDEVKNKRLSQMSTNDKAELQTIRRDMVGLYTAYGEIKLSKGVRIGGKDGDGNALLGKDGRSLPEIELHYILAGKGYDFGGIALANFNEARMFLSDLGIPSTDPVAQRVFGDQKRSDMSKVLSPHENLTEVFAELKTTVQKNNLDAQWLESWLKYRGEKSERLSKIEESFSLAAKQDHCAYLPRFANYEFAKIRQDQALLNMAFVAAGQKPKEHLAMAKTELTEAYQKGWDGALVMGSSEPRRSDIQKIVEMYNAYAKQFGLHELKMQFINNKRVLTEI
jgi:hypothetical protein